MQVKRFEDPAKFLGYVQPFLMRREAEHNLMLGLLSRVATQPDYYESYYFAAVEDHGELVAAAMRTVPHPIIISDTDHAEAIAAIADDVCQVYGTLPGVQANKPVGEEFCREWQQQSGQSYHLNMAQRIYQLTTVEPVNGVRGQMRQATRNDKDLLLRWMSAFMFDADHASITGEEQIKQSVERSFDNPERVMFLWEVNGVPVAMTAYMGPTPNGMRIGAVYTPPEYRRNGYASALVAGVSQLLLDMGRRFCFLYTDLANPTSNHIYQNIGYEPVCDSENWRFSEANS